VADHYTPIRGIVIGKETRSTFGTNMTDLWDQIENSEKSISLGDEMRALRAQNVKEGQHVGTVNSLMYYQKTECIDKSTKDDEIRNDDASRAHIESLLKGQGIIPQVTFDNLVFHYLNMPVGIRDQVIVQNINQVKEQIVVRQKQMETQQQAGYVAGSFDVVERENSGMYEKGLKIYKNISYTINASI
jgi:hypothetical protein